MTYSIVARDPNTGELGIGVQSRFFAVGRLVPWIEGGVGAIASQAFVNPAYGYQGLSLLRAGVAPQEALQRLLSADSGAAIRQVAMIDAHGGTAVHTGASCLPTAGHALGASCAAQANLMARETVWRAMVDAFERASGDLAERLLAAMEAAEREGGDLRGKQAAALIVVSGQRSENPRARTFELRVDDHPDPVGEIKRLLSYARAHNRAAQAGERAFAGDVEGALADLETCCTAYPDEPEFVARMALTLLASGRTDEARARFGQIRAIDPGWAEFLLRFARSGVIPIAPQAVESWAAALERDR
ncbi:MAG TPA: DUF1028 domain-containing protein [Candidatus Binataceae bacterium]|nr:DUF1028 domain-containing protein [Candidatus Binataceae bacterium]